MSLTIIPFMMNIAAGAAIWTSSIPRAAKVIITVLLIGKMLIYVCALNVDTEFVRNMGLFVCGIMNLAGIVYGIVNDVFAVTAAFAMILLMLLIWKSLAVINYIRKVGNRE